LSRAIADILWTKACQDYNLAEMAVDVDPKRVGDQAFGYLLQQSVEKALKSLILRCRMKYERTHDLRRLMDHLSRKIAVPPEIQHLDELSAFATQERYEAPMSDEPIDRRAFIRDVEMMLEWVQQRSLQP